ncbi:MAG: efflux RND transporter periplasmic adaptor subunit [Anaerolineales bacterium]|nr:efflux RND transporter periplasmic adaptor subunit [Anaerolineales bacterium]
MDIKRNGPQARAIGALVTLGLLAAACAPQAAPQPTTALVTTIDTQSAVEASGPIEAEQNASIFWRISTGTVATVNVTNGQMVKAGDALMTVDIVTAPQNVIQAQADLIKAEDNLATVLEGPTEEQIAAARLAVVQAEEVVTDTQRSLNSALNPDVAYYQDQVARAQEKVIAAQSTVEADQYQISLRTATDALNNAKSNLEHWERLEAQYPGYGAQHGDGYVNAQTRYARALEDYNVAKANAENSGVNNANALANAQEALEDAQANLAAAQRGPDAEDVNFYTVKLEDAQARLAKAQEDLADMLDGVNDDDLAVAQAAVDAAKATVAQLTLTAPFDGEVLSVNYLPGDPVSSAEAGVVLARRDQLHINVNVDEADITSLALGDAVIVTFDAIGDLELPGSVVNINPVGVTTQGLVRYTVRVDLEATDPRVLLGMTADVSIVTDSERGVLAVPLDAVQSDNDGEYVNLLKADGTVERVAVETGAVQDDLIVVRGSLSDGDTVQVPAPQETTSNGPFGG